MAAFSDHGPTSQTYEVFDKVSGEMDVQLGALREVEDGAVAEFAGLVRELEIPAIHVEIG